jgi:hypothetical protein
MKAFLAEQLALAQVLFENFQAGQRVVEFEQLAWPGSGWAALQ